MADYLTVTCRLPAAVEESLAEALEMWPALGCQVEDLGSAEVGVTVYLDEAEAERLGVVTEGLRHLGAVEIASASFAERDWLAEYRRGVRPVRIGRRFWVDPRPDATSPPPDGRVHLVIEPRQAFGTGSHESTRLSLMMLEDLDLVGSSVLDVGTGSGILAFAARGLGASWVVALDIDPDAVFIARQTASDQLFGATVSLFAGTLDAVSAGSRFDVVLANMLPHQFGPLLGALRSALAPDGRVVLSGLMADQRAVVESELDAAGLCVAASREAGEWVGLVCDPR